MGGQGEVNNIYPHQSNADAVMNSEIGYEICVLKVHVEPLLKTIGSSEREYSEVRRLLDTLEQFIALPTNIIPPQSLLREFVGGSWYYDYGVGTRGTDHLWRAHFDLRQIVVVECCRGWTNAANGRLLKEGEGYNV